MRAIQGELLHHDGAFRPGLAVVVDGDRVTDVVPVADLPPGAELEDWGRVAITPGTVNAHGHSFQSLLKGFADDRSFDGWRDDVLYPFSDRLDRDGIYAGALFAFAEALLAGVTTTVDFFYLNDNSNENAEQVIRAARDIGIRLVLARCFYDLDAPTSAPSRYRERAGDAADRLRALADSHKDDPLVSIQPAPHSLHAASPETIAVAKQAATDLGVPWHLHLAEARYEIEQVHSRFGTTPVRLLEREGLLDEQLVAIHAVWVDDEEIEMLAAAGCAVVHCAGANAFLGDGTARIPEMIERGVRIALGPDGGCANNRQSIFDEMRTASLAAKARLLDGAALPAPEVFRLGTRGGGDVLGLPVGDIAAGAFADLVALDLTDLSLQPLAGIDRHIVHSMQPTAIAKVMVGGELVVADGRPAKVDASEVASLVEKTTDGWVRP